MSAATVTIQKFGIPDGNNLTTSRCKYRLLKEEDVDGIEVDGGNGNSNKNIPESEYLENKWKTEFGMDKRNQTICKILMCLVSKEVLKKGEMKLLRDSILYARKIEASMFDVSTTRDDYFSHIMRYIKNLQETWLKQLSPIKVFDSSELLNAFYPALQDMYNCLISSVPEKSLIIADTEEFKAGIANVRNKLHERRYKFPTKVAEDIMFILDNFLQKKQKLVKHQELYDKIENTININVDDVMRRLGYCCGRTYYFKPFLLYCHGAVKCTIAVNSEYWKYRNSDRSKIFCLKCFDKSRGDEVTIYDDSSKSDISVKKDCFDLVRNNAVFNEKFVECSVCRRRLHQVCTLYIADMWPDGFVCDNCLTIKKMTKPENKCTAKKLPHFKLSSHIENRVNNYINSKNVDAGPVTIRVVSYWEKDVEIKYHMKKRFVENGTFPAKLPYSDKALLAFQESDGVEVCFFALHVQEYGTKCPAPNSRSVYISYMDSVQCFKPKEHRTAVYYEILLGYMDYVKQLGYTKVHIWVCPPKHGDDYIFHWHPPNQKMPTVKMLLAWYLDLIEKGIQEGTVFKYTNIYDHYLERGINHVTEISYFEDDVWQDSLEKIIEVEGKTNEVSKPRITGKRRGRKRNVKPKIISSDPMLDKMLQEMNKHKEVYLVVELHSPINASNLPEIKDPDSQVSCDLMLGRYNFLCFARDNNYEFSSLRRIKFSTMTMLHKVHKEVNAGFHYTCDHCKSRVKTWYHCDACDDFDLCLKCYNEVGHPHNVTKIEPFSNDQMEVDDCQINFITES